MNKEIDKKNICLSCKQEISNLQTLSSDPEYHNACLTGNVDRMIIKRKLSRGASLMEIMLDSEAVNMKMRSAALALQVPIDSDDTDSGGNRGSFKSLKNKK